MKKIIVLLVCLLTAVSAAAAERVEPLPVGAEQLDFANGSFGIQVEQMDRIDRDRTLVLSLYVTDRYAPEQVTNLQPGDTILVSGKTYTVQDVSVRDERWSDEDPEEYVYEIGTVEENWDGIRFSQSSEGYYFANVGDWTAVTFAGTVTVPLPLSASFAYYDYPGGEEPEKGSEADLLADLRESSPRFFNPYNTMAVFENGELTEIHNWSYPWGPDTGTGDEDDA